MYAHVWTHPKALCLLQMLKLYFSIYILIYIFNLDIYV